MMYKIWKHISTNWNDVQHYAKVLYNVYPSAIFIMFFARIYLEIQYYGYQCNKSK